MTKKVVEVVHWQAKERDVRVSKTLKSKMSPLWCCCFFFKTLNMSLSSPSQVQLWSITTTTRNSTSVKVSFLTCMCLCVGRWGGGVLNLVLLFHLCYVVLCVHLIVSVVNDKKWLRQPSPPPLFPFFLLILPLSPPACPPLLLCLHNLFHSLSPTSPPTCHGIQTLLSEDEHSPFPPCLHSLPTPPHPHPHLHASVYSFLMEGPAP